MKFISTILLTFYFATTFGLVSASTLKEPKEKKNKVVDTTKVNFKFGGRVDLLTYFDTYNSVENRNGAQYMFPMAPILNSVGQDINFQNRLRVSVAPTRLNMTVNVPKLSPTAKAKAFVEVDFMGVNESVLGAIRLRHAYFSVDWKNQSLLVGQTSHLVMIDDIAPNVVTFGGGYPLNTLNRCIQFRFTQRFAKHSSFDFAASILSGKESECQGLAVIPDFHARLNFGSKTQQFGFAGGLKVLKPRALTADSMRTSQKFLSFDFAAYYKGNFKGHTLTVYALWAQDANPLGTIGGYAPLLADKGKLDYGYAPTSAISAWIDYQTPKYDGFSFGAIVGGQKNLGAFKEVDLSNPVVKSTIPNFGIDKFLRVAPRILYDYKMLTFGLEYMYNIASWGKTFDTHYRPTEMYPNTFNNRVTLLARFKF